MSDLSGHMGSRLAEAIAEAGSAAHKTAHRDLAADRHDEKVSFIEFLEGEGAVYLRDVFSQFVDEETIPDELKPFMDKLKAPDQPVQLAAIIPILAALGWMMGQAALSGPMSRLQTISMRNFGDLKPDPAWAASMAATRRVTRDQAGAWIDDNGFTEVNRDLLIEAAETTIAPGIAMTLLQRGEISAARFGEIMGHNGVDLASINDFAKLALGPPSASEYLAAATENQLTEAQAREGLALNGIDPVHYQWLYETNGRSPGIEELNKLMNYGLIDPELYRQGILESPIKNKYVDALENSRFKRPPMEQTLSMVRRGVINHSEGVQYLMFNGYFPDDAEKLVDWAESGQAESTKELSVTQTINSYQEQLISRSEAQSRIVALRYDSAEAEMLLDLADARRDRQRLSQSVNRVHTRYVTRQLDRVSAVSALDRLQVPPAMRDDLIENWDVERDVQIRHLTLAEISKAAEYGLLQPSAVRERLLAMGYSAQDADILMVVRGITPPVSEEASEELTKAEIRKAITGGGMTYEQGLQRVRAMGYSDANAQLVLIGLAPESTGA